MKKKARKRMYNWACSYWHEQGCGACGSKWYDVEEDAKKALSRHVKKASKKSLYDHWGNVWRAWSDSCYCRK